ncbi:hypothetical protein G6F68_013900 [Rhizopus microsporus]|nr:hypothetical protein G6F68_013900 [Rhizopus microsporus]
MAALRLPSCGRARRHEPARLALARPAAGGPRAVLCGLLPGAVGGGGVGQHHGGPRRRDADLATVHARAGRPISMGCDPGDITTGLLILRRLSDAGLPAGVVPGARSALAGLASLLRDPVGGAAVHQQHRARVRLDGAAGP